jgi:hypothetical protein
MSSSLERVQHDLNVIRSALPSDFPYDRGNVSLSLLAGACGIPLALRAIPGWNRPMLMVLAVFFVVLFVAYGRWLQRIRAERAVRPHRWSWNREETVCSLIAALGLVAYVVITRWSAVVHGEWNFDAWRAQIAGPVLFAFGVGLVSLGGVQSVRRSWLGWGLPVLAVGAAAPWVTSVPAFHVMTGIAISLGGLISAAILLRQVREAEASHDAH